MRIDLHQLREKSILITGSCGLIGSALVEFFMMLNQKYGYQIRVTAMSRNKKVASERFKEYINSSYFDILECDVCLGLDVGRTWNYIIHAASNSHPAAFAKQPVETMKANVLGTINLLDYLVVQKNMGKSGSLLYISTGEIYGSSYVDANGFLESNIGLVDSMQVRACYPESKRAAETLCVSYASEYHINTKIARLGYVYGPTFDDKNTRADVQFFRNAFNHENIILKSSGAQIRSYCYITDAIWGLIYVLLKGEKANAYNISNKNSVCSIKQFAEMVARESDVKVVYTNSIEVEQLGYSKMKQEILNTEKLEDLGWKAEVGIEEGIKLVLLKSSLWNNLSILL